ncbi:MAG: hypothetical protein WCV50_00265 [Patescibacteria group bacterium]|jgi:hypothetical protein
MKKYSLAGNIYIPVLITITLFVSLGIVATTFMSSQHKLANQEIYKAKSFEIAEAGTEYYRWHLAHAQTDYQDGTGAPGPYVHTYKNTSGENIGQFSLDITPPPNGSTIVYIKSSGKITDKPNLKKMVKVKMGIPSFTNFAVAANDIMRFGEGTEVFGPIHSNSGMRFDGLAHNTVTSHEPTYTDPDSDRCTALSWGVHTCVNPDDPSPPTALPTRNDVFMAGREVDADYLDFAGITQDLRDMQLAADADGIYLTPSGGKGYHLTLRADGKIDMRIVNSELYCQYYNGGYGNCSTGGCSKRVCANLPSRSCTRNSNCPSSPAPRLCLPAQTCQINGDCPLSGVCQMYPCSTDGDCDAGGICSNYRDLGYCSNNFNRSCYQDSGCTSGGTCTKSSHSIGTSIDSESEFTYESASSLGIDIPASGLIFVEDDAWIDGVVNNYRVTIVAAKTPLASGNANIYLNSDLVYTPPGDDSGDDAVGLIAQNNILVGYFSDNDLEVDAALIAQNGRVGRPYYGISSSSWHLSPAGSTNPAGGTTCAEYRQRNSITSQGAIGTYVRYGFAWVGSLFTCPDGHTNQSGYCTRNLIYDENFYFAPPPYFPTTGQYRIISWEEE